MSVGSELWSTLVASNNVHWPLRKRTSMRRSLQYRFWVQETGKRAFIRSGPMVRLVKAIERAGFGRVSLDWLVSGDLACVPKSVSEVQS